MLVLRNITKTDKTISADYYPEDEKDFGHIEVDISSGEILFLQKAIGHEFFTDATHAVYELMRIAKSEKIPKERVVMWY